MDFDSLYDGIYTYRDKLNNQFLKRMQDCIEGTADGGIDEHSTGEMITFIQVESADNDLLNKKIIMNRGFELGFTSDQISFLISLSYLKDKLDVIDRFLENLTSNSLGERFVSLLRSVDALTSLEVMAWPNGNYFPVEINKKNSEYYKRLKGLTRYSFNQGSGRSGRRDVFSKYLSWLMEQTGETKTIEIYRAIEEGEKWKNLTIQGKGEDNEIEINWICDGREHITKKSDFYRRIKNIKNKK